MIKTRMDSYLNEWIFFTDRMHLPLIHMHESNPISTGELNSHVKHPIMNGINLKCCHAIMNARKLCAPIGIPLRLISWSNWYKIQNECVNMSSIYWTKFRLNYNPNLPNPIHIKT